jgi:hypothetical protein
MQTPWAAYKHGHDTDGSLLRVDMHAVQLASLIVLHSIWQIQLLRCLHHEAAKLAVPAQQAV